MMEDVSPAQVQAVPPRGELAGRSDKDAWELREGMLVRKHRAMRLTLFTPARMKDTPVLEEHLSGQRRTVMQQPGGAHVINDDYKLAEKPTRSMMERWRGETQFEILPEFRKLYGPSAEASASSALEEQPRKFARTLRDGASSAASSRPQRLQDPLDDLPVPSPPERLKDPIDDLPVPSPPERLQDPVDDLPVPSPPERSGSPMDVSSPVVLKRLWRDSCHLSPSTLRKSMQAPRRTPPPRNPIPKRS